jgi:hypothetical protein
MYHLKKSVILGKHKLIGAKVNILRVLFGVLFGIFWNILENNFINFIKTCLKNIQCCQQWHILFKIL